MAAVTHLSPIGELISEKCEVFDKTCRDSVLTGSADSLWKCNHGGIRGKPHIMSRNQQIKTIDYCCGFALLLLLLVFVCLFVLCHNASRRSTSKDALNDVRSFWNQLYCQNVLSSILCVIFKGCKLQVMKAGPLFFFTVLLLFFKLWGNRYNFYYLLLLSLLLLSP